MKILFACDGSEVAVRAAAALVSKIEWFREAPQVHLLSVHLPIPVGLIKQHVSQETIDAYYREEGEAALQAVRRHFDAAHIACELHVHVGQPAEVIVRLARQLGCDLIAMGTHGRGAVAGTLMGSVATKVLHLSERPVLFPR